MATPEIVGYIPTSRFSDTPIPVYGVRGTPDRCSDHPDHAQAMQVEFTIGVRTIATDGDVYLSVSPMESSDCCDVITFRTFECLITFQHEIQIAGAIARKWIAEDELFVMGVLQAA